MGGKQGPRAAGGQGAEAALRAGLGWLTAHQDADGKWDTDEFMQHDPAGDQCTGPAQPEHDAGVTGLALLALLGDGHTTVAGAHKERVAAGIKWLKEQQDPDCGLLGSRIGHAYTCVHGIATLALTEAYYFSKSPLLKGNAQKAINFVTISRNPYGAWRYDSPPVGDNDTSVTGWMTLALKSADDAGLKIDSSAFPDAMSWFDEVTDPSTGRTGYDTIGSPSSRVPGVNDHYPKDKTECMTAVAILCRFFLGQEPGKDPIMDKGDDLLLEACPSGTRTDSRTTCTTGSSALTPCSSRAAMIGTSGTLR